MILPISPARIALIGALGLIAFAVEAALIADGLLSPIDAAALQTGAGLRDGPVGAASLLFTLIGAAPGLIAIAAFALLTMSRLGEWAWTALPPLSLLLAWVANPALKCAFLRERPSADLIVPTFTDCDLYAFPSGHAMHSAALFGVLVLWVLSRQEGPRGWLAAGLALFPILIGLSRVVLGVHWLSDIVGGWLAGLVVLSVVVLLGRWTASVKWRR